MRKIMIIAGPILLAATSHSLANDKVVVTPVARMGETLTRQPLTLPAGNPVVTVSIFEIPPKARLPEHRHAYPRYGYVLSGKLRVKNTETGNISDIFDR